jgi:phosphotransferase system enzyme I (PtsI)
MPERIAATTLSAGIALGPALLAETGEDVPAVTDIPESARAREAELLDAAFVLSVAELKILAEQLCADFGRDKAEIFESHVEILGDEDFRGDMDKLVAKGYSACHAVKTVADENARDMEELEDEYFRARADDFRDIGRRVISHIQKVSAGACRDDLEGKPAPFPPVPSVIVSPTLSPGQTVQFHTPNVLGFVVCSGGQNSHAAILARSLGIPAVVIAEDKLKSIANGKTLLLNLEKDLIVIDPDGETRELAAAERARELARKKNLAELHDLPAVTACGKRIGLYANGGSMKDIQSISAANADGIGLFRTEFLFMEQTAFPDESSQTAYYRRILDTMDGKPVIVRLLDIGGDKPLPYAPHPQENNPFLGWRGIRYLLGNPETLKCQLRSLLRASSASGRQVRIMVPMVSRVEEMRAVRDLLEGERKAVGGDAALGMMVETPAAAMTVSAYAGLISFISIGSNDLTQYTLAADRENELLGDLYNEFHPGVLALMKKACEDAHACGMEAGVCGEFASRPEGALYLAAMGFDELSMSPGSIAAVKEMILGLELDGARSVLSRALSLSTAAETASLARDFLSRESIARFAR